MPDIAAFGSTQFVFFLQILRDIDHAFQHTAELLACLPAGQVVRITCNYSRCLSAHPDFILYQPAGSSCIMVPPVRRIYVIADMPVIVYTPAFPITVTDLTDFLPAVVKGYPPDLFMSEMQFWIRRINMHRYQVNGAVCIFGSVSVKNQWLLHFLYFNLFQQFFKIGADNQLCAFRHYAGRTCGNTVPESPGHILLLLVSHQHTADHRIARANG